MLSLCSELWNNSSSCCITTAIGAGSLVLIGAVFALRKFRQGLIKTDWKKDVVYLYQFPRSPYAPNLSPFCLKLETFLRRAKIAYEVSESILRRSKESKVPFIELNGVQYHDSDFIMQMLTEYFKLDHLEADLSVEQKGMARAIFKLTEQSLCETMIYNRFLENMDGFFVATGKPTNFVQRVIASRYLARNIRARADGAGIGRHSPEEVHAIAKSDVEALSRLLGNKQFFFGDKPHNIDIVVWSVLVESYYMPFDNMIKDYIVDDFKNLEAFILRMKAHFWPDWDKIVVKISKR